MKNADVGERRQGAPPLLRRRRRRRARANLGAGSITANYDGFRKHRTVIGDHVRIGVDTMLVAPVEVGDSAYTGAGSVITEDVPEGSLGIARAKQENVEGFADRKAAEAEEERES